MNSKLTDLNEIRRQVEARCAEEAKQPAADSGLDGCGGDGQEPSIEFIKQCLDANEFGDGVLYASVNRTIFLYCKTNDCWLVWTGHHWEVDRMGAAAAAVEKVVLQYARGMDDARTRIKDAQNDEAKAYLEGLTKDYSKRIYGLRTDRRRTACLKWAHTIDNPLAIAGDELDTQPMLLACPNGVIDLSTGQFRAGRRDDYLLKACPTEYRGLDEPASLFCGAVSQMMLHDAEMVAFVQRLLGAGLVGEDREQIFSIFIGGGANGKSLLADTICSVLGPLAGPLPPELLLNQGRTRSSAGPSPDIMSLRGLRIAFCSETDEGARFSPSRVKWLSGEGLLVGRSPHDKDLTRFRPTHSLFLLTNERPQAPGSDAAFWRRVILIEFGARFTENPVNTNDFPIMKDLKSKLTNEYPGILAWLVKGCLLYQQSGLQIPAKVKAAIAEYQRSEDILGQWLDERCELNDGLWGWSSELYNDFREWWEKSVSSKVPSPHKFGRWMKKRFACETPSKVKYLGVGLRWYGQN